MTTLPAPDHRPIVLVRCIACARDWACIADSIAYRERLCALCWSAGWRVFQKDGNGQERFFTREGGKTYYRLCPERPVLLPPKSRYHVKATTVEKPCLIQVIDAQDKIIDEIPARWVSEHDRN